MHAVSVCVVGVLCKVTSKRCRHSFVSVCQVGPSPEYPCTASSTQPCKICSSFWVKNIAGESHSVIFVKTVASNDCCSSSTPIALLG